MTQLSAAGFCNECYLVIIALRAPVIIYDHHLGPGCPVLYSGLTNRILASGPLSASS